MTAYWPRADDGQSVAALMPTAPTAKSAVAGTKSCQLRLSIVALWCLNLVDPVGALQKRARPAVESRKTLWPRPSRANPDTNWQLQTLSP